MKKIPLLLVIVAFTTSSCVSNSYYDQLLEIHKSAFEIAQDSNFISPIKEGEYVFVSDMYSGFGIVRDPFRNNLSLKYSVWLFCKENTEVVSVCDGFIKKVGFDNNTMLNQVIIVNGDFEIIYGSIKPDKSLVVGMKVQKGQAIGLVKFTGDTMGPRLRIKMLYKNVYINPIFILSLHNSIDAYSDEG